MMTSDDGALETLPVLDMERFAATLDNDVAGIMEIANVFLVMADELADALAPAKLTTAEAFTSLAHEIGTCFGIVGASRGERRARRVEQALRKGEALDITAAAAALIHDLNAVVGRLRGELTRLSAPES